MDEELAGRVLTWVDGWVIRLDAEGRCTEFTEWWMRHPD
jgi:hypothetical protein